MSSASPSSPPPTTAPAPSSAPSSSPASVTRVLAFSAAFVPWLVGILTSLLRAQELDRHVATLDPVKGLDALEQGLALTLVPIALGAVTSSLAFAALALAYRKQRPFLATAATAQLGAAFVVFDTIALAPQPMFTWVVLAVVVGAGFATLIVAVRARETLPLAFLVVVAVLMSAARHVPSTLEARRADLEAQLAASRATGDGMGGAAAAHDAPAGPVDVVPVE